MRVFGLMVAAVIGLGFAAAPAAAAVSIQVDLSTQRMHVQSASGASYDWPVSTARMGYVTPNGHYGVQSLQAMHYSKKYHNSPMPHSIFFHGGYAIHGTYETASLGAAASHGCVRLSPSHAAALYDMVRAEGGSIDIVGSRPGRGEVQVARHRRAVEPETVAYDEDGYTVAPTQRYRRAERYARAQRYAPTALGYAAPARPAAPSYGEWIENPFGAVMSGY